MTDCLFCKIAKKEAPSGIIYEDENVIGVKNIHPEAPVHLIFIIKKHITWQDEFSPEDLLLVSQLIFAAKQIANEQKIDQAYKLIFNVGKTAHLPHIHLHLLGGWQKDIPKHNV